MEATAQLIEHLKDKKVNDLEWHKRLDELFLSSVYRDEDAPPFFSGPDGLPYYAFVCDPARPESAANVSVGMQEALGWGTGAVIQVVQGATEWVYSPGDVVALATFKTITFRWQGEWAEPPKLEDYQAGNPIQVGTPSKEMLTPGAARCLEGFMRKAYRAEARLQGRIPAVALLRPQSRTRTEQPSELTVNAGRQDFDDPKRAESFEQMIRHFLPRHLWNRLISFDTVAFPEDRFTPLTKLIEDGGMAPVPEF